MRRWSWAFGLLGVMGLAASQPAPVRGDAGGFQVIVSAANPVAALSRADIAGCYMGEPRQWSDGEPVVPVDQSAKSPVRAAFSQVVLGRSVDAVQIHWMKLITAGRSRRPPLTASEQDILNMVARERRMVGYVSAEIPLPPTVKAVALRD